MRDYRPLLPSSSWRAILEVAAEPLDLERPRSIERSHFELREVHPQAAGPVVEVLIGSAGLGLTRTGSTNWALSSIFSASTND